MLSSGYGTCRLQEEILNDGWTRAQGKVIRAWHNLGFHLSQVSEEVQKSF